VGEVFSEVDLDYFRINSPVFGELAWEIEVFLVRHFEYGNYSFRSALRGFYGELLRSVFYVCRSGGRIVGVAGGLYSRFNPTFAVLGPVCVAADYRRRGIGSELVNRLLNCFYYQGCRWIYLGISGESGAEKFYEGLGFARYSGIVMRKRLFSEERYQASFTVKGSLSVRRMEWEDFCGVSVLMVEPAEIMSFDFEGGIFSTRYFEAERFLGVFPAMMERFGKYGGFGNVLFSSEVGTVVGVSHIKRFVSGPQRHLGVFDFFVHDDFVEKSIELVEKTVREAEGFSVEELICYCPVADGVKQGILLSTCFKKRERLEGFLRIGGKSMAVDVYRYEFSSQ